MVDVAAGTAGKIGVSIVDSVNGRMSPAVSVEVLNVASS